MQSDMYDVNPKLMYMQVNEFTRDFTVVQVPFSGPISFSNLSDT
jgi:hypothetical protein